MPRLRLILVLLAFLLPPLALADSLVTALHTTDAIDRPANPVTPDRTAPDGVYVFSPGRTLALTSLFGVTNATLTRHGATFGSISYTAASALATAERFAHASSQSPLDVALFTINTSIPTGTVINNSLQDTHELPEDTKDLSTPEPSALLLLLPGTAGMLLLTRRRV